MGRKKIEPPADRLLTTGEVAAITGFSADRIRKWTDEKKIPHLRFGKQRRYWKKKIEEWLESQTHDVAKKSQGDDNDS